MQFTRTRELKTTTIKSICCNATCTVHRRGRKEQMIIGPGETARDAARYSPRHAGQEDSPVFPTCRAHLDDDIKLSRFERPLARLGIARLARLALAYPVRDHRDDHRFN